MAVLFRKVQGTEKADWQEVTSNGIDPQPKLVPEKRWEKMSIRLVFLAIANFVKTCCSIVVWSVQCPLKSPGQKNSTDWLGFKPRPQYSWWETIFPCSLTTIWQANWLFIRKPEKHYTKYFLTIDLRPKWKSKRWDFIWFWLFAPASGQKNSTREHLSSFV